MKRDIQIKLKAVSADHCSIQFSAEKGWTIAEKGKDRLSSNGTFIFMKSMQQMNDHVPSDMIPLHDNMIISFVNYELKVSLLQKTGAEMETQMQKMDAFFANEGQHSAPAHFTPSPVAPAVETQGAPYTAEVDPVQQPPSEAPAASEQPAAEAEQPPAEGEEAKNAGDPTEEELAQAATKISAVYRGQKARQQVNEMKTASNVEGEGAPAEEAKAEEPAAAEAEQPAEGEAKPEEAKAEDKPEGVA